jgi:hypothetical protein
MRGIEYDDKMSRRRHVELIVRHLAMCSDYEKEYLWRVIFPQYQRHPGKGGRPPIGERAMTGAERVARWRARQRT